MNISVFCQCGHEIELKSNRNGQVVVCPRCGEAVRIQLPVIPPPLPDFEDESPPPKIIVAARVIAENLYEFRLLIGTGLAGFCCGVLCMWLIGVAATPRDASRQVASQATPDSVLAGPNAAKSVTPTEQAQNGPKVIHNLESSAQPAVYLPVQLNSAAVPVPKDDQQPVQPTVVQQCVETTQDAEKPILEKVKPVELKLKYASEGKHEFEIEVEEDEFTRTKTLSLKMPCLVSGLPDLDLSLFYIVKSGVTKLPSEDLHFGFVSTSKEWKYLDFHPIHVLLDQEPLDVGKSKHDGKILTRGGGVIEFINVDLDLAKFFQMVNSRRVKLRVGNTELAITAEQLDALRELASMIPKGETSFGRYSIAP